MSKTDNISLLIGQKEEHGKIVRISKLKTC